MDMPTLDGADTALHTDTHATLARVAQALGCSPDRFFEPSSTGRPKNTSQLIQMWLAIRSPQARDAVFAFVSEVLREEGSKSLVSKGMDGSQKTFAEKEI